MADTRVSMRMSMLLIQMNDFTLRLIIGTLIGLGAGYVGAYMVLRRMSLVGDALSHVALPGIAIALLLHTNPFIGAFAALIMAVIGVWALEKRTALPSETLVGIFFTTALAIGLLITPEPELLEALLGDISKIGTIDLIFTVVFVILVLILIRRLSRGVIMSVISKDLARSMGININGTNFLFLSLVAIVVALGLKVAGTLLMGSLVIIPAAAARNVAINLKNYTLTSALIGGLCAVWGIVIAHILSVHPGPIVVLLGGVVFLATLPFKK